MTSQVQIFLNNMLDSGEKKKSVSGLNYIDYFGEQFVHIERKMGFADVSIPVFSTDTYDDIRKRIESHPAYY